MSYISVIVTSTFDLCKRESQNAFGYGIDLTPEMEKQFRKSWLN